VAERAVRRPTTVTRVHVVEGDRVVERPDRLVTEEPLAIRVHGPGQDAQPLAVTMRTPGADFDLAVGFCLTEGVISSPAAVAEVAYCLRGERTQEYNEVTVRLREPVDLDELGRRFVANASCGICGKTAVDQLTVHCAPVGPGPRVPRSVVAKLPTLLRDSQAVFEATGGLHAAGLFDADGGLRVVREDVGRHNALDKVIGWAAREELLPLTGDVLVVSGRMSFEIVQKAAVGGIPILCAVSAPSSLAVEAAARFGQTLVGFLRDDRFNVYTHPERIDLAS
jgi:FdhD protein